MQCYSKVSSLARRKYILNISPESKPHKLKHLKGAKLNSEFHTFVNGMRVETWSSERWIIIIVFVPIVFNEEIWHDLKPRGP